MASLEDSPHISGPGCRPPQTLGRSEEPKSAQRMSAVRCGQRTPASFPAGKPGMGAVIDGAMQHAPQPDRQSNGLDYDAAGAAG